MHCSLILCFCPDPNSVPDSVTASDLEGFAMPARTTSGNAEPAETGGSHCSYFCFRGYHSSCFTEDPMVHVSYLWGIKFSVFDPWDVTVPGFHPGVSQFLSQTQRVPYVLSPYLFPCLFWTLAVLQFLFWFRSSLSSICALFTLPSCCTSQLAAMWGCLFMCSGSVAFWACPTQPPYTGDTFTCYFGLHKMDIKDTVN